jgi:hypothetical protein
MEIALLIQGGNEVKPFSIYVNGKIVHIREASEGTKSTDVALLERFYTSLSNSMSVSVRDFPLRGVGVPLELRSWAITRCVVAVVSGSVVAVGAVDPDGDRAHLALWADPELELRRALAQALLRCAREGRADGKPFRRLTTHNPDIASTLGFRRVHGELSELHPVPWRAWGDAGTDVAQTLLIARLGGWREHRTAKRVPMARLNTWRRRRAVVRVVAALHHADGGEIEVILVPDESDRSGGALARKQAVVRIGSALLPFGEVLSLMRGRPKNIKCNNRATVQAAVEQLKRARVSVDEVIVTSYDPDAVRAASAFGVSTGLLIVGTELPRPTHGRKAFPPNPVPSFPLARSGADFVVLPWHLYRTGVPARYGDRPVLVGPVREARRIRQAAKDHMVHGVLISGSQKRARRVLEQLARAPGGQLQGRLPRR